LQSRFAGEESDGYRDTPPMSDVHLAETLPARPDPVLQTGFAEAQAAERLERIARLTAMLLDVPVVLIVLFGRQGKFRLVARHGLAAELVPAALTLGGAVSERGVRPVTVADASRDERLRTHPLVAQAPQLRFLAGYPLTGADGCPVGELWLMSPQAGATAAPAQLEDLLRLAEEELARTEATANMPAPFDCPGCDVQRQSAELATSNERLFREIRQRRRIEQTFRTIVDSLPAYIAQVDREERLLFLNRRAAASVGKLPAELIGCHLREAFGEAYYASRKEHIDAALAGSEVAFETDLSRRGKELHYHSILVPDRDLAGEVSGFFAMTFDITERRKSELQQAQSEERLRTITDNLPVLISYIDREERYRFANATHERWFGLRADIIGRRVQDVMGTELYLRWRDQLRRGLAGENCRYEMDVRIDGEERIVETLLIPHVRDGAVQGVYTLTADISPVKAAEMRLRQLARLDPLTELPNRRGFDERLREAVARAARSGQPIALMFLDVDYFKQINDSFGHDTGDEVLREFARRLKTSVRTVDAVSRIAGDEFTVILEGVRNRGEAAGVAEKIIASMQQPFLIDNRVLEVTTSIGVACLTADEGNGRQLYARADQALYRAKAAGRNCYRVAPDPEEENRPGTAA
jgi:diguanylate cyclase (GGDEF)-like protein/PAS domain S-box-containing protein